MVLESRSLMDLSRGTSLSVMSKESSNSQSMPIPKKELLVSLTRQLPLWAHSISLSVFHRSLSVVISTMFLLE
jgi:hypothetical protein